MTTVIILSGMVQKPDTSKVIDMHSGKTVSAGDTVRDFRGGAAKLISHSRPKHENSTGRVFVEDIDTGIRQEFYPGVYGLEIVD